MSPASAGERLKFDGYLFRILDAIGTKAEGPSYYLQEFDGKEVPVLKHAEPWQDDPSLHEYLGKKVTVTGELQGEAIRYSSIDDYEPK